MAVAIRLIRHIGDYTHTHVYIYTSNRNFPQSNFMTHKRISNRDHLYLSWYQEWDYGSSFTVNFDMKQTST